MLLALILSGICTFLFDIGFHKWQHEREVDKSWKALNEQLEREGKERWDRK